MGNRYTNHDIPALVRRMQPFKLNTAYAESIGDPTGHWPPGAICSARYTVYSYGRHFPMAVFAHAHDAWFINKDRYSRTTGRHQGYVARGLADAPRKFTADTSVLRLLADGHVGDPEVYEAMGDDLRSLVANAIYMQKLQDNNRPEALDSTRAYA